MQSQSHCLVLGRGLEGKLLSVPDRGNTALPGIREARRAWRGGSVTGSCDKTSLPSPNVEPEMETGVSPDPYSGMQLLPVHVG